MWGRILRSLQYHKARNSLLFLLFATCFSLLILIAVLNIASGERLEDMQTVLGDAVYVRKIRTVNLGKRNNLAPFRPEEIEELASDSRVKGSNVLILKGGNLTEGSPCYSDEEKLEEYMEKLEHFVKSKTEQVLHSRQHFAMKPYFEAAAVYYQNKKAKKET